MNAARRRLLECDRSQELPEWAREEIGRLLDHASRQAKALRGHSVQLHGRRIESKHTGNRLRAADTAIRAISDRAFVLEDIIRKVRRCLRNDNVTAAIEVAEAAPVPETLVDWTREDDSGETRLRVPTAQLLAEGIATAEAG